MSRIRTGRRRRASEPEDRTLRRPRTRPWPPTPRPRPALRGLLALPAILLVAVLAACGGDGGADADTGAEGAGEGDERTPIPAVEAVQARRGGLPLRERLTGTVRASGQVGIYPQVSGPVVEVLAENGDRVERGDPLVRIRAETSRSRLAQARAALDVARAEARGAEAALEELEAQFARTRTLAEDSLVSQEALETQGAQVEAARASAAQARAEVQEAEAAVEERREAMGHTVVRAPISGRVGQRNVEVGMQVDPQTALFTIGSLREMRVEVPVTQELLGRIEQGQRVEVRAESLPDTVIVARVSRISPFLEEGSFSAEAEIDVPNPAGVLAAGMFVTVDVFYGESEQAVLVPKSALYEAPETGRQGVFVAPSLGLEIDPVLPAGDEEAGPLTPPTPTRFLQVEVLAEGSQLVGLGGEIEEGDWVIVVGQHLLSDRAREGSAMARVRPVTWERIVGYQRLQRQDLLREFMEKQQRLARERADSLAGAARPPGGAVE